VNWLSYVILIVVVRFFETQCSYESLVVPLGATGVSGVPGQQGATGFTGLPGQRGASGATGATGPRCGTGTSGATGFTGLPGICPIILDNILDCKSHRHGI